MALTTNTSLVITSKYEVLHLGKSV